MAIYKPYQVRSPDSDLQESKEDGSVRIISCVHGPGNVPSMINLVELMRGSKRCSLKLYGVHLVELTDRSSSIVMVQRVRRNWRPFVKSLGKGKPRDQVAIAFKAYSKGIQPGVEVRPTTAISDLPTMHEDICHVAKHKRASMVILPFHRQWRGKGREEEEMEDLGHGWRMVNQRVLQEAPCSVAVLVDRGFSGCSEERTKCDPTKRVGVLFFGGPDDRLALELGEKISERSMARVTVIHFIERDGTENNIIMIKAKEQEEEAMKEFNRRWSMSTEYTQKIAENLMEEVMEIGRSGAYDLIIVGKDSASYTGTANVDPQTEFPELGMVGGSLASSSHEILSTVLVVQHHDLARKDEAHPSKIV